MKTIYQKAIDKWGIESQVRKIQEEAIELALSISHLYCSTKNNEKANKDFISECADVCIMMKQAELIIGKEILDSEISEKLKKLQKHLDL